MHRTDAGKIAALPMYDFDALACAHDTLWTSLAAHLTAARVTDIPTRLCRGMNYRDGWRNPRLLLSQGCEYPLATTVAGYVRVVAIPHYDVPGCSGPRYSSAIVVAREHPATRLEDMRGSRCVVNTLDSNSGMNLLRAAIAPLVGHSCGGGFFQSVSVSGAHCRVPR